METMKGLRRSRTLSALGVLAIAATGAAWSGCGEDDDNDVDQAAEDVQQGAEEAGQEVEQAAEDTGEAAEDAGKEVEQEANEADKEDKGD